MTQTQLLVLVAVCVLVAAAVGVVVLIRKKRSRRLRHKFGPEYGRTVARMGDRTKAEDELRERQRRWHVGGSQ